MFFPWNAELTLQIIQVNFESTNDLILIDVEPNVVLPRSMSEERGRCEGDPQAG